MEKIDPEELNAFAIKKFSAGGIVVAEDKINEVVSISECQPYYFQMLCHVLWDLAQERGVMDYEHIKEAIDTLISRESSTYVALWEALTTKQKKLMVALAKEEYPEAFSRSFLEKYDLGAPSSIQKALKNLQERDLVQQENGSYIISDLFFKKWIRRTWD